MIVRADGVDAEVDGEEIEVVSTSTPTLTLDKKEVVEPLGAVEVDDGTVNLKPGRLIKGRYKVEKYLGAGTFGLVCRTKDINSGIRYAMKVVDLDENRLPVVDINSFGVAFVVKPKGAQYPSEVAVLKELNTLDTEKKGYCVPLIDHFEFRDKYFIIMELLGISMYDFQKSNDFQPFCTEQAVEITRQLVSAADFMHSHQIVHTDLKPANIAFVCADYEEVTISIPWSDWEDIEGHLGKNLLPLKKRTKWVTTKVLKRVDLKILDFGLACSMERQSQHIGKVGSRPYRAPESVLRTWWSYPLDMWSIGCILFEVWASRFRGSLYTLFGDVRDNRQHLFRMETFLGPIPPIILNNIDYSVQDDPDLNFLEERKVFDDQGCQPWERDIPRPKQLLTRLYNYFDESLKQQQAYKLIKSMLQYFPKDRVTSQKALQHRLLN